MRKVKDWWKDFLNRMSVVAEEEFGGRPPECCSPSSKEKKKKMGNYNAHRKAN